MPFHQEVKSLVLKFRFWPAVPLMVRVVGVAVPDRPGGLGQVLSVISQAGIDVEYMYSVFGQKDGEAFMIFRVADTEGLTELFEANKIHRIKGEDLGIH